MKRMKQKTVLLLLIICCLILFPGTGCSQKQSLNSIENQSSNENRNHNTGPNTFKPIAAKEQSNQQISIKQTVPITTAKQRVKAKGIYVSAWSAIGQRLDQLIQLVDNTQLNAMVIDIKNDSGQVTYDSNVPLVNQVGSDDRHIIPDMKKLIQKLKAHQIYTIGRVVVFKDPYLAATLPGMAMHAKTGEIWHDAKGISWVDPYNSKVWDYNLDIAVEAAELGFDEIQFDYVRFPENGKKIDREVQFSNPQQWSKGQAIQRFLQQAKEKVKTKGAWISADVFGLTTSSTNDMGIGQDWQMLTQEVDYLCPMVYPSHYSKGVYQLTAPDLQPYAVVSKAMSDALLKNRSVSSLDKPTASIRPWLQDFTATWVKPHIPYGYDQVKEQIKAAAEQGIDEYLLWNSKSVYSIK